MKFYQEITLIPDAEVPLYFLWTKVYTRLHTAFADQKNKYGTVYAVSFPEYNERSLGTKVRILALKEEDLKTLNLSEALKVFADYVHLTRIRPIPEGRIKGYAVYSRYQPENSLLGKIRRYVSRHDGISYEQASDLIRRKADEAGLPYITLKSATNGQRYPLFIRKKDAQQTGEPEFNTFGLSRHSSVPEF
jgi:CRISPR-associated endonuclease Csy4